AGDRGLPAGYTRRPGALRLRADHLRAGPEGGPAGSWTGTAGRAAPAALAHPPRPRGRGRSARARAPGTAGARLADRRAASRRPEPVGAERAPALRQRVRHPLGRAGVRSAGERARDRRPRAGPRLLSLPWACLPPRLLPRQ